MITIFEFTPVTGYRDNDQYYCDIFGELHYLNRMFDVVIKCFDDEITEKTIFIELEEWSSLTALSIIAMVDEEYGVKITGKL